MTFHECRVHHRMSTVEPRHLADLCDFPHGAKRTHLAATVVGVRFLHAPGANVQLRIWYLRRQSQTQGTRGTRDGCISLDRLVIVATDVSHMSHMLKCGDINCASMRLS